MIEPDFLELKRTESGVYVGRAQRIFHVLTFAVPPGTIGHLEEIGLGPYARVGLPIVTPAPLTEFWNQAFTGGDVRAPDEARPAIGAGLRRHAGKFTALQLQLPIGMELRVKLSGPDAFMHGIVAIGESVVPEGYAAPAVEL